MESNSPQVYQFKISLDTIQPEIWRRIQVPADYTFWDLHVAIQDSMGWLDYHLHAFRLPAGGDLVWEVGIPHEEDSERVLPGWELALSDYFSGGTTLAEYEYDFGDGWLHTVTLEETLPRETGSEYPRCLAGGRNCPPEDCGGAMGYQYFLEAVLDPGHQEHQEMLGWVGDNFDPERFDPNQISFDDPNERWHIAFGDG